MLRSPTSPRPGTIWPVLAATLVAALAGCAERTIKPRPPEIPTPARVAVLPLRVSPGAAGKIDAAAVPDDAGGTMARTLTEQLAEADVAVVDADTVLRATPGASAPFDAALARSIGDQLGANVIAVGTVRRYVEREGTGLGVTAPASVAYDIVLVRASDGTVLGTDRFDYTQVPLNQNLLDLPQFIAGGGRWQTRAEILDRALGATARRLAHWLGGRRDAHPAPGD